MRFKALQKKLRGQNISCAILSGVSEDPNLRYVLGMHADSCLLFVPKNGNSVLLAQKMEIPHLKTKTSIKIEEMEQPVEKKIAKIVGKNKTIGINKNTTTVKEFEWLKKFLKGKKYKDISSILYEIRSIKDDKELGVLKDSCRIADKIMKETFQSLNKFKTEGEVKNFMLKRTAESGCEVAFEPLIASAKNTGFVHYSECNKKIKEGFFYIDFGVDYKGYKSDITRTTYIGTPSQKERQVHNNLLKIQKEAIKMAKPGMACKELDNFVRRRLENLNPYFTHALGHGVGLEVHEKPIISKNSNTKLKEGMVITIEPGIYFPGKYGIRIEDTIAITKTGAKVLTKTPKNFI